MTSKERLNKAMRGEIPDRVPVMCQLSFGHIYKNAEIDPVEFWYTSEGLAKAYIRMAEKYRFDGILLSKPGRDPLLKEEVKEVSKTNDAHIITWKNGSRTFVPKNEAPYSLDQNERKKAMKSIKEVNLETINIVRSEDELPVYYFDVIDYIVNKKGESLSIHGEVATVFEKFLWLFGSFEHGLMAIMDDPDKCLKIMYEMNKEVIVMALAQCKKGIDALKLSSPIAGQGFISREMYKEFVLPLEKQVIAKIHENSDVPCYIHTCGSIGDRLDLIASNGTDGIECLDPYPIGNVHLEDAVKEIGDRVFIKGNLDSVNEMLDRTPMQVLETAKKRIETGKKSNKGYILSTACSVAPDVSPENIMVLHKAVEEYGVYKD